MKHYHSREIGCELVEKKTTSTYYGGKLAVIHAAKCITHDVECCHCGWEWGWHYETLSRAMTEQHRRKLYPKVCPMCKKPYFSRTKKRIYCSMNCYANTYRL